MYESLIFLDPNVDISASQVAEALRAFYESHPDGPDEIRLDNECVTLHWGSYQLWVGREAVAHAQQEAAEIAERFGADHPDQERIARSRVRLSTGADDDPDMDHFNDYLYVGEVIGQLGKVYRFDQASGEFLPDE
jgi:hypothetical protein